MSDKDNRDYRESNEEQEPSHEKNDQSKHHDEDGLWDKQFEGDPYLNSDGVPSRVKKKETSNKMPSYLVTMFVIILLIIIITAVMYFWYVNNRPYNQFEGNEESIQLASSQSESLAESESISESESIAASESESRANETTTEETTTATSEETTTAAPETTTAAPETTTAAPETSSQAISQTVYVVQAGDNLYRIALNHGVSEEAIMQANGMTSQTVFVGQELIIPQ